MATIEDVLIAGAGPTGLAAALFLADRGRSVRIIDKAEAPARNSRAQVINPRSLELLEPTGVADRLCSAGRALGGVRFYDGWSELGHLDFADLHPRFPMVVLPQARTEAILAEALSARNLRVERGSELVGNLERDDGVSADVRTAGSRETLSASLLLAADGAHSPTRERLGIGFEGSGFPESWPLYDIRLDTPLDIRHAHVSFVERGLVFLLQISPGIWRVFGDVPEPLDHLPPSSQTGDIIWRSSFHISHRIAEREACGRVVLAGDAAHIHSPVAARGMNLGIEDAAAFAEAVDRALHGERHAIEAYAEARHRVHRSVVRRIERLTFAARGRPALVGALRDILFPAMTGIAPLARAMLRLVSGLDHTAPGLTERRRDLVATR